jgi:3-phenylpropionate/trans-cinnamate dioxygenase alpha subunit
VDRAADPVEQAMTIGMGNHIFGPAGLLEQEDGENWAQSTAATTGRAAGRIPQLLKMDLGRGQVIREQGLCRIEGTTGEHAQLWTYSAWAHWMAGESWDELKAHTTPPDVF